MWVFQHITRKMVQILQMEGTFQGSCWCFGGFPGNEEKVLSQMIWRHQTEVVHPAVSGRTCVKVYDHIWQQ